VFVNICATAVTHISRETTTGLSPTRFPFQFRVIQDIPRQHATGHSPLPLRSTENQYHRTSEGLTTYPGQDNNTCIYTK